MTRFIVRVSAAVILFGTLVPLGRAQTNPNLEQGLKPYGSFNGGNIDRVSLTNGNLFVRIPLLSIPQRGALRLNYVLQYNDKGWALNYTCDKFGNCFYNWMGPTPGGIQVVQDQTNTLSITYLQTTRGVTHVYAAVSSDGSTHQMGQVGSVYRSIDASGFLYDNTNGFIEDRTGVRYYAGSREDPNGNQITLTVDTLNRSLPGGQTTTDYSNCTGPLPISSAYTWTIPGPSGTNSVFKFCSVQVTLYRPAYDGGADYNGYMSTIQSVVLPDGTAWTFQYVPNEGNLASITFPTGGTLSYTYTGISMCINSPNNTRSDAVQTRILDANDGTGPHTWTYTWGTENLNIYAKTRSMVNILTDPLGNDSVQTNTGLGGSCSYYETQGQYYQGSQNAGTLLKTINTDYSYAWNPYSGYGYDGTSMNVVPIRVTTTWPNGQVTKTETDYDSGFTFTIPYPFPSGNYTGVYGNAVAKREYDYGSGAPPANPVRQTLASYLALSNSNYLTYNLLDRISSVTIQDGSGTRKALTNYAYDGLSLQSSGVTTQHNGSPINGTYRGNQTSSSRWLNTTGHSLTTTTSFYDTGLPYQTTDPGNHTTTFTYSSAFYGAYVTQTQFPDTHSPNLAHHIISGNYDFNTGLLTSFTDENSQTSSYTYDNMWRFVTAIFPGNPTNEETDFYYPDAVTVERKQKLDSSHWTDLYVRFDGVGREIRRITANGESTPWDQADTCHDALGRVGFVSYPYQGTGLSQAQVCSGAGDSFTYDGLGRTTAETHSDGTSVTTSYTGRATSGSDEGNGTRAVQRISQVDGLGRLVSVCEVTSATQLGITPSPASCGQDISATGFLTAYSYDTLDNPTGATQGGLSGRSFQYDSLSRLTSSTNPEAGTTAYSYDNDSLLITRVAPAPNQSGSSTVTTTYTNDELHRPRTKVYSDGTTPGVTISYDESSGFGVTLTNTTGRESSAYVTQGSTTQGKEISSYDPMGRVQDNSQCTPQNCASGSFPVRYTYDLNGNMLTETNGLGTTLTYSYNAAERITGITSSLVDGNHPASLLSSVHYNAFGGGTSASLGNSVAESLGYTARGWLQSLSATLNSTSLYSFSLTFAPNGDVSAANDSVNGNWSYAYDDFNRLSNSTPSGQNWWYTYDYDRFGNRWHQSLNGTGGTGPTSSLAFDANNRITSGNGVSYDAAGNVTNDGVHSYSFDAENRIISVDGGATASYVYNANGQRIRKTTSSGSVDYLYDLAGHVITELSSSGAWNRGEVFAAGHHVATYASGTTYFIHADWLGTERKRTDKSGNSVETCTNMPFGDGQSCSGSDPSPLHFTGKQRDTESGLDDFGARYFNSRQARWLTPDWSAREDAVPYATLSNPQTLNLYAYVGNNPVSRTDANGHIQGSRFQGLPACSGGAEENHCAPSTAPEYDGPGGVSCPGCSTAGNPEMGPGLMQLQDQGQQQNQGQELAQAQQQNTDTVTIEEVKGQGFNFFNHEAISVDGKQPVGLEQKKDCGTCAVEGKTTPGAVRPVDPKRKVLEKVTIHITRDQAGRIQTFLDKATKSPPNYNLYHSNCAEFCAAALGAGGVKAPRDVTPGGLVDELRKLYPQP